jgi:hypothetical protein
LILRTAFLPYWTTYAHYYMTIKEQENEQRK